MSRPILLDTCAILWLSQDQPLEADAATLLAEAERAAGGVVVSPISAWELGMLASRGKIVTALAPAAWFDALIEAGASLAPLTPAILIASSFLPDCPLRDPADRILAATARALNYRLMTRDAALLAYSAAGHLEALAC